MNNFFLHKLSPMVGAALVVVMLFAFSGVANAAESTLDDNWYFTLIPYIWLPSLDGSMNINPKGGSGSGSADLNADDYLDSLQFAAMLTLELEKGRWSLLSDIMYVDFSNDDTKAKFPNLPGGGLEIKADAKLKALAFEVAPAYALYRSESTRFDLLAGIRYIGMDTEVTLNASTPLSITIPSRNFSERKDIVDPIVGFKGRFELGKGWFLPYYLDIGGFGVNDEWTWQAFGGVGYHFSKLFSMVLAYRHLQYNFNDNKLVKDFYMTGAQLGFIFRF